jgi:hypothetical protein
MPKLIQELETWGETELAAAEAALDAAWVSLKPQILALGQTVLGQVLTAAETFVETGGNYADAIAVVVAQLPADAKNLEAAVGGAVAAQVAALAPATITPATPAS